MTTDLPEPVRDLGNMDRRSVVGGLVFAGLAGSTSVNARETSRAGSVVNRWIVTTQSAPWQIANGSAAVSPPGPDAFDVAIEIDKPQQTMEGFGACFNEMGWDAIRILPPADQERVFSELFGDEGAGFTLCRMPIGANDFSRDWYSYDETPGDFALRDFDIGHDDGGLIPFIKMAQRVRGDIRLWASPWSPPSWMKVNGHYAMVPNRPSRPANGLNPGSQGREGTDMFIQEDRYFDAYARYFGRFIDAYQKRGIRIGMVMPQNEFNSAQPFPSCCWTPAGLTRFLPFLGREMGRRDTEIFFGTLERGNDGLFEQVYADAPAASVIRGVGVQWAGKQAVAALHRSHPTLRIYQSEQECGDGRNDWRYARYTWSLMKQYLQNGAAAYDYWNIALIDGGVSRWGWAQNSLITVDKATRTFRWNHEYWLMKHLSANVKPGARRVGAVSWTGYEDVLAFINPDNSVAIIAHNSMSEPLPLRVLVGTTVHSTILPADSFGSIRVSG